MYLRWYYFLLVLFNEIVYLCLYRDNYLLFYINLEEIMIINLNYNRFFFFLLKDRNNNFS